MKIIVNYKHIRGTKFFYWLELPFTPAGTINRLVIEGMCTAKSGVPEKAFSDIKAAINTNISNYRNRSYPTLPVFSSKLFEPKFIIEGAKEVKPIEAPTELTTLPTYRVEKKEPEKRIYEVIRLDNGALSLVVHDKELLTKEEATKVMFERAVNGN